ncbi:MAG: hypothetical protein R3B82_05545 [Sandaracinaceae bacterium]
MWLLSMMAGTAAAQPRVTAPRPNDCDFDREDEVTHLADVVARGRWAGDAYTAPTRAAAVPGWLRRHFGLSRERWGSDQTIRGAGPGRVDVSPDGRHVHLRYSSCGDCDCSTSRVIDAVYDEAGRLVRSRYFTETCECVDSQFIELALSWDTRGRVTSVRRVTYVHPTCSGEEDPPELSYATLSYADGSMPAVHDALECQREAGPDRFECSVPAYPDCRYTVRWAPRAR